MFGKNQLLKQEQTDGQQLWVQEIFLTLQGEGPLAGEPAVFIRLAGCNLRCHFCDTDFESSQWHPQLEELLTSVKLARGAYNNPHLVVLTGGEPLRQNVLPLIRLLSIAGYHVQIETAGTLWLDGLERLIDTGGVTLVCSPKTGKIHPKIAEYCHHWKYITRIGETSPEDGLPDVSTQVKGQTQKLYRPRQGQIWLQPCDEHDSVHTEANVRWTVETAQRFGYRVSLQLHKILHLP